jgi:hypothetical protein
MSGIAETAGISATTSDAIAQGLYESELIEI